MASEQTPVETPQKTSTEEEVSEPTTVEKDVEPAPTPVEKDEEPAPTPVEKDEEPAPTTVEEDEEPAPTTEPTPTTGEEAPAKPSAKEKISGFLHQTQDKIKGTVAGLKEKTSSKP